MKLTSLLYSFIITMAVLSGQAKAADLDTIIPVQSGDPYVPVEVGSGWYIRGDLGYNFNTKYHNSEYTFAPITHQNNFRDAVTMGGGFGYRVNEFFRVDATVDRLFNSSFESRKLVAPTGPCNGTGEYIDPITSVTFFAPYNISNCLQQDKASYNAMLMMANAYVDLGNYGGVTPFLGAGLGAASIGWKQETGSITCTPQNASVHLEACKASGTISQPGLNEIYTEPGIINNGQSIRLAYSISAGFSYKLSPNMNLDTSYKFTSIGLGFKGIPSNSTPGSSIAGGGVALHQIKMGLRYDIW